MLKRNAALMRRIPSSYPALYQPLGKEISLSSAERQHASYANALSDAGVEVHFIDADEAQPDCVFVEDTAVLWGDCALVARPPEPRAGEERAVSEFFRNTHEITRLPEGAYLEGGDVLATDAETFVGVSSRTNECGAFALRDFFEKRGRATTLVEVPSNVLHLKCAVTYLGFGTVSVCRSLITSSAFDKFACIEIDAEEANAANCVRVNDAIMIAGGYPRAKARLSTFAKRNGLRLAELDISEFEKGEGSLTCLSLLWSVK